MVKYHFLPTLIVAFVVTVTLRVTHALPAGFSESSLFKGERMTDMVWIPSNDFMLVSLKEGIINLHYPGDDYSYATNKRVLDIQDMICTETERGLGSIQLHPDFGNSNHWIYMYYTFPKFGNCDRENPSNGPVNRLSRWEYLPSSEQIDATSEVVLLDTPSTRRPHHNSGNIHFGNDGLLYVSIGDQGDSEEAQNVANVLGSIVRLTDTGGIPPDNPFAKDPEGVRCHQNGRGNGKCQELYAIGLRNPWRFAFDYSESDNGPNIRFFVNDVGAAKWEEISEGGTDWENATEWGWEQGIMNFGWPVREGPCKRGSSSDCIYNTDSFGYIHPLHYYPHNSGGAVTAGTFIPKGVWPNEYDGQYIFADFVFYDLNILTIDAAAPDKRVDKFLSWPKIIVAKFGPYKNGKQALYYTEAGCCGEMRQVVYTLPLPVSSPSQPPSAAPSAPTPDVRPPGASGYPGGLFRWSSGDDCAGYDFCGVLEFCMNTTSPHFDYGYRVPCSVEEECECRAGPGPLIRLVPGNRYRITLRNAGTESTNLHTHGLHIVGSGNGDDVTRSVSPQNCLDYVWDIQADLPGGTHWYHSHLHTLSEKQVGGGAFGMLVVADTGREFDPSLATWARNERLLQVSISSLTEAMFANGRTSETIDISVNQWSRLRVSIVNANAIPYNFVFEDRGMCDIHKVANDGVWRSTLPGPKSSVWELTGASRADFAIRCNVSEVLIPILYRNNERIGQLWVRSESHLDPFQMVELQPTRPDSIDDMRNEVVTDTNKMAISFGFDYVQKDDSPIEYWNAVVPLATIAYDQVHEWTVVQTKLHPFHLHMYHMQIVTPGGCGAHEEGEFYDTISAPDNCTVRFRTADFGQRCVLHCHVLEHEDQGSMSWVNVTGVNMPTNDVQSPEYSCPQVRLSDWT